MVWKSLPLLIANWLFCYCRCNAFHSNHCLLSTCMLYFTCTCMLVVSINDATCNYMYSMFFSMGVTELPQILLQRALYMYEEDPINFRKCTIWWDPPWKNFFFLFPAIQSAMSPKLWHKKAFSAYGPNLFDTIKCLVTVTAFQIQQKHPYREIFVHWSFTIIVRGSLSSNVSKVCQTALGTVFNHDLQFISGTRNFTSAEQCL